MADARVVGDVEHGVGAALERPDRAVRTEVVTVTEREVAGTAEGGEAEPDPHGPDRTSGSAVRVAVPGAL